MDSYRHAEATITQEIERTKEKLSPFGRELWRAWDHEWEEPDDLEEEEAELTDEDVREFRATMRRFEELFAQLPDQDKEHIDRILALGRELRSIREVLDMAELADDMRWLGNRMQAEGLRRGLNKEERGKMTLGEAFNLKGEDRGEAGPEGKA